jgi:hypothetical protein
MQALVLRQRFVGHELEVCPAQPSDALSQHTATFIHMTARPEPNDD